MFGKPKKRAFFSPLNSEESSEAAGPFEASIYVRKYLVLTELQESRVTPSEAYERDRELLFAKIIRGIKKSRILLDYFPINPDCIEVPVKGETLYTQALFYWCARLDLTIPLLLEAIARNGNATNPEAMTRTIQKIVFEDSVNETDSFFAPLPTEDSTPPPEEIKPPKTGSGGN